MSWRKGPPPPPSKPVAVMPERLQVFDVGDWLEPGEDAAVEADARAAYERHLEARRQWYAEHELPPIADAIATVDEPFDPAAAGLLVLDGVRCGSRAALEAAQQTYRDQLNTRPLG